MPLARRVRVRSLVRTGSEADESAGRRWNRSQPSPYSSICSASQLRAKRHCRTTVGTDTAVSAATDAAYAALEARGWHVAKLVVASYTLGLEADQPTTTILRSALMKPEHLGVVDAFADALATLDCR